MLFRIKISNFQWRPTLCPTTPLITITWASKACLNRPIFNCRIRNCSSPLRSATPSAHPPVSLSIRSPTIRPSAPSSMLRLPPYLLRLSDHSDSLIRAILSFWSYPIEYFLNQNSLQNVKLGSSHGTAIVQFNDQNRLGSL